MRALPGQKQRRPSDRVIPSREDVSQEQRKRILSTMAKLVAEGGYSAATVDVLVAEAGVGLHTLRKHCGGREGAFFALLGEGFGAAVTDAEESYAATSGKWPAKISAAIETLFGDFSADPVVARACLIDGPTVGPREREFYDECLTRIATLCEPGRKLSRFPEALPASFDETVAAGVVWIVRDRLAANSADLAGAAPDAVHFVLRSYLGDEEARRATAA